jgi:hypothetical protein
MALETLEAEDVIVLGAHPGELEGMDTGTR